MNDKKRIEGRKSDDLASLLYGKVPPQSKDLEEAVLGALMIEKTAIYKVVEYLTSDVFYIQSHKYIYEAILALHNDNLGIDVILVSEKLRAQGRLEECGGAYGVIKLTNSVVSTAHLEEHCRIIVQMYIKRKIIHVSAAAIQGSYDDTSDSFNVLDAIKTNISEIENISIKAKATNIDSVALNIIEKLKVSVDLARRGEKNPNDIYTFLPEWDKINGALFPGLYVVAGRPGMGKGVHLTECIARMSQHYPVGVVNGEMTDSQLLIRLGCNLLGLDNFIWKKDKASINDYELEQVQAAMEAVINLKLHITDEKDIDLISSKVRYWSVECGVKVVFIDFLTLLRVSEEKGKYWNDRQKINYILQVLCGLNKALNIPIILYAQLNRALLQRASKEPNLGDLKESGSIEELAFQISFLHRPEYYETDASVDEFGESTKGLMYQIIAKHRDGTLDRIKYRSILQSSKLVAWDNSLPSIGSGQFSYSASQNKLSTPHNIQSARSVLGEKSEFDNGFDEAELY